MENITASLATIPSRITPLKEMVDSILPQVHTLQVYLNGFEEDEIPTFLLVENKVKLYRSQDYDFGDRGDAGKFFNVQNIEDWHLICDDDIHYPEDYAEKMIQKCNEHDRKFIIGCHGGDFNKFPVLDSYKCRRNMSHYKKTATPNDYLVHFLATNSVCFHSSTIDIHQEDFKLPNMGDIWLALLCQQKEVGMVCREKAEGWIQDCKDYDPWDSIFGHRYKKEKGGNADIQTETVNSLGEEWRHYGTL